MIIILVIIIGLTSSTKTFSSLNKTQNLTYSDAFITFNYPADMKNSTPLQKSNEEK